MLHYSEIEVDSLHNDSRCIILLAYLQDIGFLETHNTLQTNRLPGVIPQVRCGSAALLRD